MKKRILLIAFLSTLFSANAQDDIGNFLALGKDAGTIMKSYLQPAFEGTMYNLNNGWYRTAKPHRLLGFDITLNASLATVPNERKNFTFDPKNYENVTLASGDTNLPTAFGDKTNTVLKYSETATFNVNGTSITETRSFEFDALDGFTDELSQIPSAMIQAGIGLPKKTDLTVRLVPKNLVSNDEFEASLIGFGLKHNILQYFPIAKRIPLVDVSLFGGYTKLNAKYLPQDILGANQSIEMDITSITGQLIGSVDLKIINLYVGLGYSTSNANLNTNGSYTFEYEIDGVGKTERTIEGEDLPNFKYDVSGLTTTAGLSLNLAFLKIYGSYTLQEYNAINAGVAFSFR